MSSLISYEYFKNTLNGFSVTPEGGVYLKFINKTGANSIKGTVVRLSQTDKDSVINACIDCCTPFGIIYENGISDGSLVKVVISGIAHVLLKNGTSGEYGYWCCVSDNVGRIKTYSLPQADFLHRQVGYCLEEISPGNEKLAKILVRFA